jgi:hypothetical protein
MDIYTGGREGQRGLWSQYLAARRDARSHSRVQRRHQGAVDHTSRRRYTLPERTPAPGTRPPRLPAAGALLRGYAQPAERAGENPYAHIPGKLPGHLCGRDQVNPSSLILSAEMLLHDLGWNAGWRVRPGSVARNPASQSSATPDSPTPYREAAHACVRLFCLQGWALQASCLSPHPKIPVLLTTSRSAGRR